MLQRKAEALLKAADLLDPKVVENDEPQDEETRSSRLEQLKEYLSEKGPRTRKQILRDTSIPRGSLTFLLGKDDFVEDGGRWGLKIQALAAMLTAIDSIPAKRKETQGAAAKAAEHDDLPF